MRKPEPATKETPTSQPKQDYPPAPDAETPTAGTTTTDTTTPPAEQTPEQRIRNLEYAVTKILGYFEQMAKTQSQTNPNLTPQDTPPQPSKEAEELMKMQGQSTQPGAISSAVIAQNIPYLVMGIGNAMGQAMMGNIMGTGIDQQMKQLMMQNYLESMNLGLDMVKAMRNRIAGQIVKDAGLDLGITPTPPTTTPEAHKVAGDTKPTT